MWLIIAANPNFVQRLIRGWRRLCVSMGLIVSKCEGQGHVKQGHQKKMLHVCCATHFYVSFGTQNTMVAFIFRFDSRNDQYKVKLSQKTSNFQDQKFLLKTYVSCPVLSQNSKNVIYFYERQFKMSKIALKKWRHQLSLFFFYHCTTKNKDIDFKFGMYVFCM